MSATHVQQSGFYNLPLPPTLDKLCILPTQSTYMVYTILTIYGDYFPQHYESAVLCNEIVRYEAPTHMLRKFKVFRDETLWHWVNTNDECCFPVPGYVHFQDQAVQKGWIAQP